MLGGCAGTAGTTGSVTTARNLEADLRAAQEVWQGTPYVPGGVDFSGIDPVSYVRRLYEELFEVELPRTASRIAEQGNEVARQNLRVGDILLFKMKSGPTHIGIYLGSNEFTHVSVEEGVMVSRMDADEWRQTFATARRLDLPGQEVRPEPSPPQRKTGGQRTGW